LLKREQLRDAQLVLIEEIKENAEGIAVLGMAGGKTASFLTAVSDLIQEDKLDHAIIEAPARVVDNVWAKEHLKWEHLQHLKIAVMSGNPAQRVKQLDDASYDVYVCSIDQTMWLVDHLRKRSRQKTSHWRTALQRTMLGIDEISKFKGRTSRRAAKLINFRNHFVGGVWGLTGTPRPNGYLDLWNQIRIVGGEGAWGDWEDPNGQLSQREYWERMHFYAKDHHGYDLEPHRFAIPALEATAQEFMVRVPMTDVELPELVTGDDLTKWVDLSNEQRGHYQNMVEDLITEGQSQGLAGDELVKWCIVACSQGVASGKLTQIVQGFVYQAEEDAPAIELKDNPKLRALAELDEELGYDPAIVCYGLREEIRMLQRHYKKKKQKVGLLGGGVSRARANKTIDDWNAGRLDRLLLHPASAGHGIELQFGGHYMIWYHPTWSVENYDQTIARLVRPGQPFPMVFNYRIAMRETNDMVKLARVLNKQKAEEEFKQCLRSLI